MVEEWVDTEEVAEFLKVHRETVRRWIRERGLPLRKAGGIWRGKLSEVEEWAQREFRPYHELSDMEKRGIAVRRERVAFQKLYRQAMRTEVNVD